MWHYLTMPKGPQGQKRPADVIGNAAEYSDGVDGPCNGIDVPG